MRVKMAVLVVAVWSVLAAGVTPGAAGQERPTERVTPAPQVNGNAVVWRTPEPPRNPQAGDVWVSPKDGAEMVFVPAGEFIMGSTDADIVALVKEHPHLKAEWFSFANEQPQVRAHLPGYWIDKYEVTVARYREFCKETGTKMPAAPSWGWHDDHPMVNVTWHDAAAHVKWAGKRLPTEAEWEKAARGTDGRKYPWGNNWEASRCANSLASTKPVGSYPSGASPYGCLDMAGNVLEWCADWHDKDAYTRYAKADLKPPASGTFLVLRGGSWYNGNPSSFRCATRLYYRPVSRFFSSGFRCVRGPE